MLTMKKEKEILYFAKSKVRELRNLVESKEVQQQYNNINSECLDWEKYMVNINNFTMRHTEIGADLITIPIKDSVKNLHKFKMAIEEISKENKLALYVNDAYEWDGEEDNDWFLRISSPSINRNIQTLRLMTYMEAEKISSLMYQVNNAKEKSLAANIKSINKLLNLGVDTTLNLSCKNEEITGRIRTIKDDVIELMIHCQPELITLSTIRLEDSWMINSIEGETPINYMWSNRREAV